MDDLGERNRMRRPRVSVVVGIGLLATFFGAGCQTGQLRQGSLNQAASYGDLQEQQVLDNLAKFVFDINSFPYFAWTNQGSNQISDTVSVGGTTTWSRIAGGIYGWVSSTVSPSAGRLALQSWVLTPINDPRKLELMRCAYQQVVRANCAARGVEAGKCPACPDGVCPDCSKRLNAFYTGKPSSPPAWPGSPGDNGRITNLCLGTNPVWFAWGSKLNKPKGCRCPKYGHYCGVYVWVLPAGEDELAKLTLAILDYAVNTPADPPKPIDRQVMLYVDQFGNQTVKEKAVGTVSGSVPGDKPMDILLHPDKKAYLLRSASQLISSANQIKLSRDYASSEKSKAAYDKLMSDAALLMQQAADLEPLPLQPRPYRPSLDEANASNLLQLQQRLQNVQPSQNIPPLP